MNWIMLIYKLPKSKTTAKKVSIWRKLKKLAVYPIQDSICILPYSERTLENLEWLSEEIKEMGGEATLWEAKGLDIVREEQINEYFLEQVNNHYREILVALQHVKTIKQLKSLWVSLNRVKSQDYLKSPLWVEVKGAIEKKALELSPGEDDKK